MIQTIKRSVMSLLVMFNGLAWANEFTAGWNYPLHQTNEQIALLSEWLEAGQWQRMNETLAPCLNADQLDAVTERRCTQIYSDIAVLKPVFRQQLQNWLIDDQDNYHALMIYAALLDIDAWAVRGHAYRNRTHPLYMYHFGLIQSDRRAQLERALVLRPDLPFAYASLISAYGKAGDDGRRSLVDLYRRANDAWPASLEIARAYLHASQPRWGGSHALLDNIVSSYQPLLEAHPELQELAIYVQTIKARDYKDGIEVERNTEHAIELLLPLLDSGYNRGNVLLNLAIAYKDLDQPEQARPYALQVLEDHPYDEFTLNSFDCTCYGLTEDEVVDVLARYIERYPTTFNALHNYGYALYSFERYEAALAAFERALELRPYYSRTWQYVQWSKDHLGIEYEDFRTVSYYQGLIVYSIESFQFAENMQRILLDRLAPGLGRAEWKNLETALTQEITAKAIDEMVLPRLGQLTLDYDDWKRVSTYYSDRANVGNHMTQSFRDSVRESLNQSDSDDPINRVWKIYVDALDDMAEDFIYRYGPSRSGKGLIAS